MTLKSITGQRKALPLGLMAASLMDVFHFISTNQTA